MTKFSKPVNLTLDYLVNFADNIFRCLWGNPRIETSQITPHLYVGGQYRPRRLDQLAKWGITGIVNMRTTPTQADFANYNIDYLHLPVRDKMAPTIKQLEKGVHFIEKQISQGGKIYVHCHWGRGRGPTMAAAHLTYTGVSLDNALETIFRKRPFIRPSRPQREVLEQFEEEIKNKTIT